MAENRHSLVYFLVEKFCFINRQIDAAVATGILVDGSAEFTSPACVMETDAAVEAEDAFWSGAGTSPLLFGSTKATSSSSLTLSVKPDEQISFAVMNQISRHFNRKVKKMDLPYSFELRFLEQSIFNETAFSDSVFKGGQYGVCLSLIHI